MGEVINVFDKAKLDQSFADRLQKEHPMQYSTLINMHLSFLLDLNCLNDENDAETADKVKNKKNWLFHKKKASVCTSSSKSPEINLKGDLKGSNLLPEMMKQLMTLIDFLKKDENLKQEGIFRKTGSVTRQQNLKFIVNQMKPLQLVDSEYTAHDVASVMKSILNDLPQPILCEAYFPAYSQIADICNSKENDEKDRIKTSLQLLFLLLPRENRTILESLIILLHHASEMESYNKMNSDSLATLFTPHLVCPRKLPPEQLHTMAATMNRMISFMITNGSSIFLVPEKLSTDIKAYFVEEKRRKETPEKILDESVSDSVANTVFTFVDREKTNMENVQSTTDTALAQLYAHIQSLPESSKKKKLIKQFNKQNGQGTPLHLPVVNRDKPPSACRSIGDSIKKHIFHKTLNKTPKKSTNTPSSSNITRTPLVQTHPNKRILFQSPHATKPSPVIEFKTHNSIELSGTTAALLKVEDESNIPSTSKLLLDGLNDNLKTNDTPKINDNSEMSQEEMIDDEDFVDSSDEENEISDDNDDQKHDRNHESNEMKQETINSSGSKKKSFLLKGVSLGNLKFPFHSNSSNITHVSPKMKKSKSSSILIDIEKDDEKRKVLMKNATESFNSSEESEMYFSLDHTKESWHVDVSNINFFLNQTETAEQHPVGVRNSMSPITKSTQRMPKSMQESIMTPRSRKPVMITMFSNSDPKSYRTIEEVEEIPSDSGDSQSTNKDVVSQSSSASSIPIGCINLLSQNSEEVLNTSLNTANNNGLPSVAENGSSKNSSESLTIAFKDYLHSRGHQIDENNQDDYSFSSQSDDFESSSEYQKLEESYENKSCTSQMMDVDNVITNQSSMSKSLLHCLDGNEVSLLSQNSFEGSKKRQLDNESLDEILSHSPPKRVLIADDADDLTDF